MESCWDESEATFPGKPLLVLARYIAPEEKWMSFVEEWRVRVLQAFSIPYFHSAELRNPKHRLYRHLDLIARQQLLRTACEVIVSHVDAGFGVYMRPNDLQGLITAQDRSRWGGAYGICAELLLGLISQHLKTTERVNVFVERGHANTGGALRKISAYRQDTEPVEWPEMVEDVKEYCGDSIELARRKSAMRIGHFGAVAKKDCPAAQAADLWAYLASTAMRNDDSPLFAGALDSLPEKKPHAVSGWGPSALQELIQKCRAVEEEWQRDRASIYELRKDLHSRGCAFR